MLGFEGAVAVEARGHSGGLAMLWKNKDESVLDDCELHDMELNGYQFTWERGHGTDDWMEIRLDRALVTNSFMNLFAEAKLTNIEISTSDHTPIFLEPVSIVRIVSMTRFRFENAWLRDPMCRKIVEETWELHKGKTLQEKIAICSDILQKWVNESVIHVLTRCSFAILCWDQLDWLRDGQEYSNFAEWLNDVFQKCTAEEVRIVSMVCWCLWKNRNDIVWNQKSSDATTVVYSARNVLDQWQSAQDSFV
ncbi:hypothetical protein POM88_052026 [Heracleum sosnowskyi]|uniref:Endonuclease/exonuclease/phosphatase domain-containing protein n=1 Tax=Heracleum sosnowskyi TaxID=360622 RepID=A0AAD8GS95_9APIA|nr:hypothetical protein POM88_052026 [Heracleum sosnowskyi]